MKVIFFGTPQFAVPTLERLLVQPEFTVKGVVSQPDRRRGRGNQLLPSPVKTLALEHQLPVWQPERIKKDPQAIALLRQAEADVFVVVAYGQILSQEILDIPKLGCINVHGSILPKYRGAAPIQWCLYHGEKETGIATMLMDAGMDTGAVLLTAYTPIGLLDNAEQLGQTLASLGAELLVETLLKVKRQGIQPQPQDNSQATYAPLIKKPDYAIDWSRRAIEIHNQVRGFFPDCAAKFRGQSLKILATVPLGEAYWADLPPTFSVLKENFSTFSSATAQPGEAIAIVKNIGPIVQTGEGLLLLQEVQIAGKRPQSGWDLANGMRLAVGEVLENG
jgi:methionyl-tRNA formyltransferase